MHDRKSVLLALWRAVGHDRELADAVEAAAALIGGALPVERLELLRCEPRARRFETAAASGRPASTPRAWQCTASAWQALRAQAATATVLGAHDGDTCLAALRPLTVQGSGGGRLVGLLREGDGPVTGLAVIEAPHPYSAQQRADFAALLEPLATLLARDDRLRALDRERTAAQAEVLSLRGHLGRDSQTDAIVGAEGGLRTVMQRVAQVARSDSSVLLLGETGSGKEVVARAIHERSRRASGPFVRVNCGALAPELVDSELFGHEKGSFTGAIGQRRGWFERADQGTLFLDEIGELPLPVQVRLLRVLQDGSLHRVGSEQPLQVDVRVIAATHRDLPAMVSDGRFREDLWYRLAVFPVRIAPVRERHEDIPELARHFARRAATKLGLPLRLPNEQDIALLRSYAWPGNVREMATVIERAALLSSGDHLDCSAALGMAGPVAPSAQAPVNTNGEFLSLDAAMAQHIRAALVRTQGRVEGRRGAARLLAINPHTLRARMRKLGVVAADYRPPED